MSDDKDKTIAITVRISADLVARIDRLVEETQALSPAGAEVTRASMLKSAIEQGAANLEIETRTLRVALDTQRKVMGDPIRNAASNEGPKQDVHPKAETKATPGETKGGRS